jgi:phage terminase Nu1 subunit (DNA packaging protein)
MRKTTKTELARRLKISRQLLQWHLKQPDAPKNLNDVSAWRTYFEDVAREAGLPPKLREQLAEQRLRLLRAQADKAESENRLKAGELVSLAEVTSQCNQAGAAFMWALEKLARELPPSLSGMPTVSIAQIMDNHIESIRRELKIRMAAIGK